MDGALQVWLDDAKTPLFAGKGYEFFARRTTHLVPDALSVLPSQVRAVLEPQQDAGYLPIPVAQRLRITWTGSLSWLHFYQLQVRRYAVTRRACCLGFCCGSADLAGSSVPR